MLFDDYVQITVSKVDRANDRVWFVYQDQNSGRIVEKEMSLKAFVRIVNSDPKAKIQQPVVN
jgi:hypothetical protein